MRLAFRHVRPRELAELYRAAQAAGCEVSVTNGDHVRVMAPLGIYHGAATGRGPRTVKNARAALRRLGVNL